ncbi:MAG: GNAT family N-acetyltransferase [Oscillospiraceae bacterium]|nr:GNAT family N-acetyltransferase [Oscillospiraceae bacterium]
MFHIKYASEHDEPFWFHLDNHLPRSEFQRKIRDQQGYIIRTNNAPIGIMRYNLFWDSIPFLTLIILEESAQKKGYGRQAMLLWENEMRDLGHPMVMTSTRVDEQAQHFYRKLGYIERGGLCLDHTPFAQPQELFLLKVLS